AIVHQDDDLAWNRNAGPRATIQLLTTFELGLLNGNGLLELCVGNAKFIYHVTVEDADAAAGDRAHGQFPLPGNAKLPHQQDVERNVQRLRYFECDHHAASGDREHHNVVAVSVSGEFGGESPAGFHSVLKHTAPLRKRCHGTTIGRAATTATF